MKFNVIGKTKFDNDITLLKKFHKRYWFKIFATIESISAFEYRMIKLIIDKEYVRDMIHFVEEDKDDLKNAINGYKNFEIRFEI